MNKCPHCKSKLITDHAFCPACGYDLRPKKISNTSAVTEATQIQVALVEEPTGPYTAKGQSQEIMAEEQPSLYKKQRMFSRPFSFNGRIRRLEYCLSWIISSLLGEIGGDILGAKDISIRILFMIILYWFMLAQSVKRCHDFGKRGWHLINPFFLFWLAFAEGKPGFNRFGRNPKE